jgi:UV excision repair protein RAD23
MGAERAAQIAEMENMGFERSQIDLAMRAAFYNSERAIEYLLTVSHNFSLDKDQR